MKKLIALVLAFVCVLGLCACDSKKDIPFDLPFERVNECGQEELDEKLIGISREDLLAIWGEPDGHLSGFWGDTWQLDNEKGEHIIVYYDKDGIVENVKVKDLSE